MDPKRLSERELEKLTRKLVQVGGLATSPNVGPCKFIDSLVLQDDECCM